jgi:hypothetical protein
MARRRCPSSRKRVEDLCTGAAMRLEAVPHNNVLSNVCLFSSRTHPRDPSSLRVVEWKSWSLNFVSAEVN